MWRKIKSEILGVHPWVILGGLPPHQKPDFGAFYGKRALFWVRGALWAPNIEIKGAAKIHPLIYGPLKRYRCYLGYSSAPRHFSLPRSLPDLAIYKSAEKRGQRYHHLNWHLVRSTNHNFAVSGRRYL